MPVYRVELAKTGRATCTNIRCKENAVKIDKGSLRHGTYVEINEISSWKWKHWGCVTPVNCASWNEITEGGDTDLIDGYDELDDVSKDKVLRAIKQGHVDDEDWIGDVEKNRPGQKGYYVVTPKKPKKAKQEEGEGEQEASPVKSKGKKAKQAASADKQEPPAKKKQDSKKASKPKAEADDDPAPASKKRGRPKKTAEEEPPAEPPAKKAKSKTKETATTKKTSSKTRSSKTAAEPKSRGRPKKKA